MNRFVMNKAYHRAILCLEANGPALPLELRRGIFGVEEGKAGEIRVIAECERSRYD